jgi:hypothetical protein
MGYSLVFKTSIMSNRLIRTKIAADEAKAAPHTTKLATA